MIKEDYTPEQIIKELTNSNYKLLETLELNYKCNCTRDKFEKGLISLGEKELNNLIEEHEPIETVCHFCNTKYQFYKKDIDQLIVESKSN